MRAWRFSLLIVLFTVVYLLLPFDIGFEPQMLILISKVIDKRSGGLEAPDLSSWPFLYNDRALSYNSRLISYMKRELHSNSKHRFSKLIRQSQDFLSLIRSRCEEESLSTTWEFAMNPVPKPRMLIKRVGEDVLFASNPKTGSTSFKRFLFYLDGNFKLLDRYHDKPRGHFKIIDSLKSDEANFRFRLGEFLKIGAIRNPLTRLISAFRDKQLRKFEFLTPGINYSQNTGDFEVFTQFIDTVLQSPEGTLNPHLGPQWNQMEICRWPYDLLIPYENISEYIELFKDVTNTSATPYPGSRETIGVDKHNSTFYSDNFYQRLDQPRMQFIYDHYALDFKLMGYSKFGELGFPDLANVSGYLPPDT